MHWNQLKCEKLERRVLNWLTEKGFQTIKQDWHYCHGQVDIIASRLDQLHFIGISTKRSNETGFAEKGITRRKIVSFLQASQQYLKSHPEWKEVIIDILTVTFIEEEPADYRLVKNIRIT